MFLFENKYFYVRFNERSKSLHKGVDHGTQWDYYLAFTVLPQAESDILSVFSINILSAIPFVSRLRQDLVDNYGDHRLPCTTEN